MQSIECIDENMEEMTYGTQNMKPFGDFIK